MGDQKVFVEAILKIIGYKGKAKYETIADIYKDRNSFTISQIIKLDQIRWLSNRYGSSSGSFL